MGIAFAIGYIPSFLIAAFIALFLCKQFAIKREKHSTIKIAGIIAGIIICAATTWWAIQLFPFRNSTDFSALIKRLATTLILPLCAGGTFVIFSFFVNKRKKNAGSFLLFLNQIGIGALHAVWVIPLSFLLYMESDSLRYRFTDKHKESVARFEELCSETELNIIKHNTNAKSLYTFNDVSLAYSLLDYLDFTEVNKSSSKTKYIQFSKKEGEGSAKVNGTIDVNRKTTEVLSSDYEIFTKNLTTEKDKSKNIYFEKRIIRERKDGKVLSSFNKVRILGKSSKFSSYSCPSGSIVDPRKVVPYTLGLMPPDESQNFEEELSKYFKKNITN